VTGAPIAQLVALVVDGRPISANPVNGLLQRAGFRTIEAATGVAALDVLAGETVDLAVVAVTLPDMSGFELCEAIRGRSEMEWLPVVHVSATAVDATDRSEGLMRGADAVLAEPLEPSECLAILTSLIRRGEMRKRTAVTAARLRALNAASADIQAASSEERVFEALIGGAVQIAGPAAMLATITRNPMVLGGDGSWRGLDGATRTAVERALEPVRAGQTMLAVRLPGLSPGLLTAIAFTDELAEPAGAILVPASISETSDEVVSLLAQMALTATLSLANQRALDVEHRIAVTLQRSLLPQRPPVIDGLEITFRYQAASLVTQVGGDFYDAVSLDATRTSMAIGDVVGHTLHAATVMGEIRNAFRAYALDGYEPAEVVARIERLINRFHPGEFTSTVYGVVDAAAATFTFCSAGHLPVLRIRGESAEFVPSSGTLLGLGMPPPPQVTLDLVPGDRVMLVTDGLIERRNESLEIGLERWQRAAAGCADLSLDEAVDRIIAEVGPGEHPNDDVAILAFQFRATR
jgi:CheY-like chemotaxis protein